MLFSKKENVSLPGVQKGGVAGDADMTIQRKIYLASSWRNPMQPAALAMLRGAGHEVYDFLNPAPGHTGFAWADIDPDWQNWTPQRFIQALRHPIAAHGFSFDKGGLDWCDTCVLLLPCGKSAHLEAGYAIGQGKPTLIVLNEKECTPDLMYLLAGSSSHLAPDMSFMLQGLDALPAPSGNSSPGMQKSGKESVRGACNKQCVFDYFDNFVRKISKECPIRFSFIICGFITLMIFILYIIFISFHE